MIKLEAERPVHFCDGMKRRDFLHAGSLAFLGLGLTDWITLKALGAVPEERDMNCIMLCLVGGPSQLDTFDMKPDAPSEIWGPYRPSRRARMESRFARCFRAPQSTRTSSRWSARSITLPRACMIPVTR